MNYKLLNGSNLAYIGDAYLELQVRYHLLEQQLTKPKDLRKVSLKYVSAFSHQQIYEKIKDELTAEEQQIFLRGRNGAHFIHRKNVDKKAYLISTGLEAVIGYLYLDGQFLRLNELIERIFQIVEEE